MKLSIVITSYNQERFIRQTVESAINQSYAGKEIIVVDDASSDSSLKVLEQYGNSIQLIRHGKNRGATCARNAGASIASGDYLVFLDGDDLLLPWALDVYSHIIAQKNPTIILARMLFFQGTVPNPGFLDFGPGLQIVLYDALMRKDRGYRCSASAIVVARETFAAVGGWTENLFPSEIEDFTIKLGYSGPTAQILSHPTTAYRVHDQNTVHQVARFIESTLTIIRREKSGEYPGGKRCWKERYAYIGGPVYFWFTKTLRARLIKGSLRLLAAGWLMMLIAISSKLLLKVRRLRPLETIAM
jgi:glycosyltransferase involved in cell wall biosynthesis